MNKVTIYRYDENKPVRTLNLNGEPWFVLRDVCEVLGLGNSRMVADRLDEDEKGVSQIDTLGGVQNATIISESGLYNVILRSDKPEAKPFRKWVTAVVLPSIRKNGGYIAGQEELSPQELMAKALLVAQKTLTDRDARIKELTAQNQIMQPKAEYFDELVARNLLTNFRETAKELGITVDLKYSWQYGASFSASAELQTMISGWYETGTEIVFACGGSMFASIAQAASANDGFVIGVDVDQSFESDTVVTSAMKGLADATKWAIAKVYDGTWSEIGGKATSLGVNENAVGLPTATWSMTNYTVEEYEDLFQKVVSGELTIDADYEANLEQDWSNLTLNII